MTPQEETALIEEAIRLAAEAVLQDNISQRRQMEELALQKLRQLHRGRGE